jgi:hypothetical protein
VSLSGVLQRPSLLAKRLSGQSNLTLLSSNCSAAKLISRFTGAILEELVTAVANSVCMLIPKRVQTLFGNGESPNENFLGFCKGITISKRQSPYGKHSHMGTFSSIPKWAQTLFGNRLVTEPSPYQNGGVPILLASMRHVQLNGKIVKKIDFFDNKSDFLTGKSEFLARKSNVLTKKNFVTYTTSVHNRISLVNFSNHKTRIMGIPVWKRGLVFLNPCMEMGIPHFHMGMCQSPFP